MVGIVLSAIDEVVVAEVSCMVKEEWCRVLAAWRAMADVQLEVRLRVRVNAEMMKESRNS